MQDGNKVYIANEDAGSAAKFAAASPNADPLVAVPQGPPRFREEWRQKFAADYKAAGGKGSPTFTVLRQPDTPTSEFPIPESPAFNDKKGPMIDPALRADSPTIQPGNKVFVSNEDAAAAAKYAAGSPNANPLVGVPPGSPGMREEWKKNFQKEYAAAGGKGTPQFETLKQPDTPTQPGARWNPPDEGAPAKMQAPADADPHTHGPAKTNAVGTERSENFGKVMGAVGTGLDGLDKAGQVAAGVQKEREKAAQDGVDFSGRNAAENVVGTAIGADSYNAGKKNAQDAIAKADKEGRSRGSAALDALWRTGKDMTGITAAQEIFKEESEKEKKAAEKEGREQSGAGAAGMTAVRVAGDKSGLNPVLDASMYDAEAERQAGDTGRRAQEKLKTELEEHLKTTGELEQRMKRLKEREDMTNPSNRQWARDLQAQYLEARRQAQEINNRTRGKMLNEADPQLIAIRQAVDLLPENPAGVDMNDKELTADEQMAAHDCSKFPNTKAGWNEAMGVPGCFCVDGYKFNKGETECVPDIGTQIKNKDCSGIAGSAALWNDSSQSAFCGCLQGAQMNGAGTACEPSDEVLQRAAQPITCPYPNTEQAWFREERTFKCVCKAGFSWDKTGYACVEPRLLQTDCGHVKGTTPYWDEGTQSAMCTCSPGHVIENNVCVPSRETQLAKTDCSHVRGATPYWDEAVQKPMCTCQPGYIINEYSVCVPPAQPAAPVQRQPQPPPFDPSALMKAWNQGASNNNSGNVPTPAYTGWNTNPSVPVPAQLPGLGAGTTTNTGGTYAGFTGFGQPSNPNPPAPTYVPPPTYIPSGPASGGVDTDGGDPCITARGRVC